MTIGDNSIRLVQLAGGAGSGTFSVAVQPNGDRVYTDSISGTSFTVPVPLVSRLLQDVDGDTKVELVEDGGAEPNADKMNFVVDGVTVGSVEILAGGITKWTLDGILDPIVYAGTPRTIAQRNALTPLSGYLVYISDGATKEYQYYDGTVWKTIGAGGITSISDWAATTTYAAGNIVTIEGRTLRRITNGVSLATFDLVERATWEVITPLQAISPWSAVTYYYEGDTLDVHGRVFRCNTDHLSDGGNFGVDELTNWDRVDNISPSEPYQGSFYYYQGEQITDNNKIYRRIAAGTSGLLFDLTEQANWQLVGGGEVNVVTESQTKTAHAFVVGDVVYNDGTTWLKASAALGTSIAQAVVSQVIDVNSFKVVYSGILTATAHGKTVGNYYFLDQTVAGTTIITQPTTGIVQQVYFVKDANTLLIDISNAFTAVNAAPDLPLTYGRVNAAANLASKSFVSTGVGSTVDFTASVYSSGTTFSGTNGIIPSITGRYRASYYLNAGSDETANNATVHVVQSGVSLGNVYINQHNSAGSVNQSAGFLDVDVVDGIPVFLHYQPDATEAVAFDKGIYFDLSQLPVSVIPVVNVTGVNGGVVFGNGTGLTQDATNFFYDNTSDRLGIGNATPASKIHVTGDGFTSPNNAGVRLDNTGASPRSFMIASRSDGSNSRFAISDETAGAERVTLGTNGFLGIGTTGPGARLHVRGDSNGDANQAAIRFQNDGPSGRTWNLGTRGDGGTQRFYVSDETGTSERFGIDSSGRTWTGQGAGPQLIPGYGAAGLNVISIAGSDGMAIRGPGANNALNVYNPTNGDTTLISLITDDGGTGEKGRVRYDSVVNVMQYLTTSDERLKTDTGKEAKGLEDLLKIKVRNYDWKNTSANADGMFAQELAEIVPSAVSVGDDELNEYGNLANPWAVDYGKLTPILIKAVQELTEKVEKLEKQLKDIEKTSI